MGSTKWNCHKEPSFVSNDFIFWKILFKFKNFVWKFDLMYQMFIFILFKSMRVLFKGAFSLRVSLTLIKIEFVQYFSKFCIYPWDIHSSKNNSGISRSCYVRSKNIPLTYGFVIFQIESTCLPSEKIHRYQNRRWGTYFWQVFWVKVRLLQDQCRSISTLAFY